MGDITNYAHKELNIHVHSITNHTYVKHCYAFFRSISSNVQSTSGFYDYVRHIIWYIWQDHKRKQFKWYASKTDFQ